MVEALHGLLQAGRVELGLRVRVMGLLREEEGRRGGQGWSNSNPDCYGEV